MSMKLTCLEGKKSPFILNTKGIRAHKKVQNVFHSLLMSASARQPTNNERTLVSVLSSMLHGTILAKTPPGPTPPPDFLQTFLVRKPLALRIHKDSLKVTHIDTNSPLYGKIYVGDHLLCADGNRIKGRKELEKALSGPNIRIKVEFRHGSYSWAKYRCTTVERMFLDKDTEKITGRAIEVYNVFIKFPDTLGDKYTGTLPCSMLGLSLKYDARERLRVVSVEPSTLGAIHIRPGDIIREVNDKPVMSKTMFNYYTNESVATTGLVKITVECPAGGDDAYRDAVEMAADVIEIASKQIARLKVADKLAVVKPCLRKSGVKKPEKEKEKKIQIAQPERSEVQIAADYDPLKLKPCKAARQ